MSEVLTFSVTFHTPFRVATGSASEGADVAVDRRVPVPGSSLKGAMRAAARDVLGGLGPTADRDGPDHPLIMEVFGRGQRLGDQQSDSPWHWEDVALASQTAGVGDEPRTAEPSLRNRIRIEAESGTAAQGALMVAEEWAPTNGTVQLWQSGHVQPSRGELHRALLSMAAALMDGLGSGRRAGNGWVTLRPEGAWAPPWPRCVDLVLAVGDQQSEEQR